MGPAAGDWVVQLGPEMDEADAVPAGVPVVASVVLVVASVGPVAPGALPPCPFASRPHLVFHRMTQDS